MRITSKRDARAVLRLLAAPAVLLLLSSLSMAAPRAQRQAANPGQPVVWYSQGAKMAGRLFVPKDHQAGRKLPTIVLVHGYTGTMASLVPFGSAFSEAGFLVFAFDYRGWGESEGEKFRLDPFEQVEDIRNALTWVAARPECDATRIGIWGTSFGGGHVIYVGAIDGRVKAIVGQVGATDGRLMVQGIARWEGMTFEEYRRKVIQANAEQRVTTGKGNMRPAWPASTPGPGGTRRPAGNNPMIPVETDEKLIEYRPILLADRVIQPTLLITAEKEELFDNRDHFGATLERLKGPKRLVEIPGITHYQVYFGPGQQKAIELALDWYRKHL